MEDDFDEVNSYLRALLDQAEGEVYPNMDFDKRVSYLCTLLREAGGEVYQRQRFINSVYALNDSLDRSGVEQIFSYEFKEGATGGMTDRDLMRDMVSMQFLGLMTVERERRGEDKIKHDVLRLTEEGKIKSLMLGGLPIEKIKRLKEVYGDLKELSNNEILEKYGKKWQEWFAEQLGN